MPRVVIPGIPHHIIQRGNRRLQTFFERRDYEVYKNYLKHWCVKEGIEILAYCLMTNHVHLIAVPKAVRSLERGLGEAHRRYSRRINLQNGWQGHLWQERFHSYPMDAAHLFEAVRYVELNPVKAKLVTTPEDYLWSSAPARLGKTNDVLLTHSSRFEIENWVNYWREGLDRDISKEVEKHSRTGRPNGDPIFIKHLESICGRSLSVRAAGRKPRARAK